MENLWKTLKNQWKSAIILLYNFEAGSIEKESPEIVLSFFLCEK